MITNIQNYFGPETIYLWLNYGVLALWFSLIVFPASRLSLIFISSVFLPIIFATLYIYIIYMLLINGGNIVESFNLYLGINYLYELFSNDNFLLIFWVHFLGINLFLGSWVSKDAIRHSVPRTLSAIFLIMIYFTGPLGLVTYWFFRIFYAKKISLYD